MRFSQEISIFNPFAINRAVVSLGTSITQTAQEIRLEAQRTYTTQDQTRAWISVKADEITSMVEDNYPNNVTFQSAISQTPHSIELTVSNSGVINKQGSTSAGIKITMKDANGNTVASTDTASIYINGSVVFTGDLGESGTTRIDGGRIATGEISLDRISGTSGTLTISTAGALRISAGNFRLDSSGTMTTLAGNIGNSANAANVWHIGGGSSGNLNRAWIYSGSKSTFSSRSTAGTYIGTDGISMRGTESNVNNFLELQNGIVKTSCIQVYDGGGSNHANILLDDEHKISIPYGLTTGDANNPRINYFANGTYCKGDLVLAGELECAAGKTTDVTSEDNEGGGQMRFRGSGSGGLNYVQFDCPVKNEDGGTEFSSDRRKKEKIAYLDKEKVRDFVMKLKPSSFVFKSDADKRLHHGVIAQDIVGIAEERNPYISTYVDDDDGESYYYVAYMEFIADLIATVQLQQQEIDALKGVLNG